MELYPGVKISIGPPIEDGFYYDFDFPDGVTLSDAGLRADRGADARAHRRRRAVRARGRHHRRGARALPRRGPGLQGRADRGPGPQRGPATRSRPSRCTPTGRSPTCAAGRTRRAPSGSRRSSCSRSPARTGAGTRRNPMLTRVYGTAFFSQGARGVPRAARARPRQRPPPARPAARTVHVLRGGARRGLLAPGGHGGVQLAGRRSAARWAASAATPRSRPRSSTTARCG